MDSSYSKGSIFVVIDMNDDSCVVEFVDGELIVLEESNVSNRLTTLDIDEIYDEIKCLDVGEYKFVRGFKFLK